jgi:hypothetical protein
MVGFKGFDMEMPWVEAELSSLSSPAGSVVSSAGLTVSSGSGESTESIPALSSSMKSKEEPEVLVGDEPWVDSFESF